MPPPLSIAIACKDNEATIGRTLESVRGLATEIVAADSGSSDGTIAMLEGVHAKIIRTPWLGYVRTKQFAVDHCTQPWVLLLDSDESPEPGLADAIRELIQHDDPAVIGARVNRRVWYRGQPLKHAFQPEWRLRLARRDRMAIAGYDPHDRVDVETGPGERVADLGGRAGADLRHDSFSTFAEHLARQARHASDAACSLHAAGKRTNLARVLTAAPLELFKQAVLKKAAMDGWAGWLAACSMASYALMKHACLLENQHTRSDAYPSERNAAAVSEPGPVHARGPRPPTDTPATTNSSEINPP